MQARLISILSFLVLSLAGASFVAGCATPPERAVTLAEVSWPARATIYHETAGGHIDKITKEYERGKTLYDVEATVGGKHMEYLIAEQDGTILGTEVPIDINELPPAVRAAAEKYFGTTAGLSAMKGRQYGETQFEIQGSKNGNKTEVTFNPQGKRAK